MSTYAETAHKVDLAMRHTDKPCIGEPCDLDAPCKRHARTVALVFRLTKQPQQENKLRTKHKRCWFCGRRLRGNKGVQVDIEGNNVDAHKSCAEDGRKLNDYPFGIEY